MSFENKNELVKYRLQRSDETLSDAVLLAENKRWNACINRLYYACYYAVNALLLQFGYKAHTHSGIKTQFSKHFIKEKKINQEQGKLYAKLLNQRHSGDYDDFVKFTEDEINPQINQVADFIRELREIIEDEESR